MRRTTMIQFGKTRTSRASDGAARAISGKMSEWLAFATPIGRLRSKQPALVANRTTELSERDNSECEKMHAEVIKGNRDLR